MKNLSSLSFTIYVIGYLALGSDCRAFDLKSSIKSFLAAPSWSSMTEDQVLTDGAILMKTLVEYKNLPPESARELIEALNNQAQEKFDTETGSKIYIFNRLYCNVPEEISQDDWQFFGGWARIPIKNGLVNVLYPLKKTPTGDLAITGVFGGYMGPAYRGLDEFDYLLKRFGQRGLNVPESVPNK